MDLSTIKRKLDTGQYAEPWQFVDDVWLMFENAWLYNRKSSKVHKFCTKVRESLSPTPYGFVSKIPVSEYTIIHSLAFSISLNVDRGLKMIPDVQHCVLNAVCLPVLPKGLNPKQLCCLSLRNRQDLIVAYLLGQRWTSFLGQGCSGLLLVRSRAENKIRI